MIDYSFFVALRAFVVKNSCSPTTEISPKTPISEKICTLLGFPRFLSSTFAGRQSPLLVEGQNMCDIVIWTRFWPDMVVPDGDDGYNILMLQTIVVIQNLFRRLMHHRL